MLSNSNIAGATARRIPGPRPVSRASRLTLHARHPTPPSVRTPPFSSRCPGVPLAWRGRFQFSISEGARATAAFSPRRSRRRPVDGAATTACLVQSPVRAADGLLPQHAPACCALCRFASFRFRGQIPFFCCLRLRFRPLCYKFSLS